MMDDMLNNFDWSVLHNMMYNRGFVRNWSFMMDSWLLVVNRH